MIAIGHAYWIKAPGNRVFIPGKVGPKWATGLVVEADGFHTMKVSLRDKFEEVQTMAGKPYPTSRVRGAVRNNPGATKGARKLKKIILRGSSTPLA